MGLSGQILLLFTALVATSRCLPDGLKTLPDGSVFELKPPKEFLDLFQPDDSKNLINPMKSPLTVAMTSHKLPDVSKFLPDPSVFEMKPPKEFSDLFQLKEKENVSVVENKENLITPKKESSDVEATNVPDLLKPAAVDIKQPKENLDRVVEGREKFVKPINESTDKVANQPDKHHILDPKVFEMKPPKEFLDLFQFKDKDNLMEEKEKVIPIKTPSDKETSLSNEKPILNPSVFVMEPPKEFLDLFQLNKKESTSQKESFGAIVPSLSLPDEKKTLTNQNILEVKPPSEFSNLFHFKEESYKPMKWPSWSFNVNNFGENTFPDWFYLPNLNPQEINKIDKHTETITSQKPQSVHWNQQTFESHSHYHQSPLVGVAGYQNVFSANEDGNDIQVRVTDKIKDKIDSAKIIKSSVEENADTLNKVTLLPLEKDVKTNKVSLIQSKEQELPPKTSVVDNSNLVPFPVQLMARPQTINIDNIPMNPPNLAQPVNYPVFGSNANMVSQSNNYPQNQQPVFMTVPYGSNRVPLNYVLGNGTPLNGPFMNDQHTAGQSVMVPNPTQVGGYSQNNLYALVPIKNDYYKPHPYFHNIPSNGYGHQVSGQVYNLVPATNNV